MHDLKAITLYREDFDGLDTTAEAEADRTSTALRERADVLLEEAERVA